MAPIQDRLELLVKVLQRAPKPRSALKVIAFLIFGAETIKT